MGNKGDYVDLGEYRVTWVTWVSRVTRVTWVTRRTRVTWVT